MANRYYGYDIITFLESLANDQDKGINSLIDTINSERLINPPMSCPHILTVTSGPSKRQFPELYIDIEDSTVDNEEDYLGGGGDTIGTTQGKRYPDTTPEIYTVNVSIMHKSNIKHFALWMEIFAEAIYRTFHKYCDSNIEMMLATQSIRSDIQDEKSMTYKIAGYSFDVTIACG